MNYKKLKKRVTKEYSKKGTTSDRKKELEDWAGIMCDACIATGVDRKKMLKSQRAIAFPGDLYQLFHNRKIELTSYNFCVTHLEQLREEVNKINLKNK